ncbi:MAG: NAD-dependent epimerase/dehydratase family protein [Myxococcaceae bacterium]|nr:NAD-dependent epimerase/dehydratase family protein [Myxococcaceae bacterium]
MKIIVTGGAGFIGSNVVDAFVALGHEVLVLDDLSTGQRENLNPKAELVHADIRSEQAAKAVEAFAPEVLNLHAAQIDVRRSVSDPRFDADVNVGGLLNVLEAARRAGRLKRAIYAASGGSMYGDTQQVPTPETHPCGAVSPYGVSKHACELYLQAWRGIYGLHDVALRYANVYGPRQNPHGEAGVVAIFTERLVHGKPCTINGDGGQTRDFVHVADVTRANVLALTTSFVGGVNIGTGIETDVNTVYRHLSAAAGVTAPALHAPAKLGEQRRSVLDNRKAKDVLGWAPSFDIAGGLANTVAWFKAR